MANRLSGEKSPYLLQHANNPVDWYPWGPEAFQEASKNNKMIFLSVGYSTCHWCHVMERESFENEEVAAIMNEHFVNVKVDREERPDVDRVYMTFVQATTGGGGWPMSVFLTPALKPVFGGTYFPPDDDRISRRPGFKTLLRALSDQWREEKETLVESGDKILSALAKHTETYLTGMPRPEEVFSRCFTQLLRSYDAEFGGFSLKEPKFPQPANFNFLLASYALSPEDDRSKQALRMCERTLQIMARGGIYDHVSHGFARYSTDTRWHVPHFEKMLYDQAQLLVAYSQAYKVTKRKDFERAIRGIIQYCTRDLRHPMGGFYSAEDADSLPEKKSTSKKEGAFCVWTKEELTQLLPKADSAGRNAAEIFFAAFGVKSDGNVNPAGDPHGELRGKNVLTRVGSKDEELVTKFGLRDLEELEQVLDDCCQILFRARQERPKPHLDDKILSAWNGLMLSGLCAAGSALADEDIVESAVKAARFIRQELYDEERNVLLRSTYAVEESGAVGQIQTPIEGFADDYAFVIRGLLDLYETTFDCKWLDWAVRLQSGQDERFWDDSDSGGGYFTSAGGDDTIVLRLKEDQDGAEPASNSVAAQNLLRMAAFLDRPAMRDRAERIFQAFSERLTKIPVALPEMTTALLLLHHSPVQIVVAGTDQTAEDMIKLIRTRLIPNRVLIQADGNKDSILYKNLKLLSDIEESDGSGLAIVCKGFACSAPARTVAELENALQMT